MTHWQSRGWPVDFAVNASGEYHDRFDGSICLLPLAVDVALLLLLFGATPIAATRLWPRTTLSRLLWLVAAIAIAIALHDLLIDGAARWMILSCDVGVAALAFVILVALARLAVQAANLTQRLFSSFAARSSASRM